MLRTPTLASIRTTSTTRTNSALTINQPSQFQFQLQLQSRLKPQPSPPSPSSSPSRPFTTTPRTKMPTPTETFADLARARRTIYALGKSSPVPDSKIKELVNEAILHVPSSFNTQSTRLVLLLHAEHEKLWDTVIDTFGELVKTGAVSEEMWRERTLPKLSGMKNGVGTVCFTHLPYPTYRIQDT